MFYVCSYVKNKTRSNVRYSVTQLVKPKSAIGVEYDLVGPKAADVRGPAAEPPLCSNLIS